MPTQRFKIALQVHYPFKVPYDSTMDKRCAVNVNETVSLLQNYTNVKFRDGSLHYFE